MSLPAIQQTAPLSSQEKLLAMIQKQFPQYHPVLSMVQIAHSTDDEHLEFACHKEVAKYVQEVDRKVQVDAKIHETRRVIVELFGDGQGGDVIEGDVRTVLEDGSGSPEIVHQGVMHHSLRSVAELVEHEEVKHAAS